MGLGQSCTLSVGHNAVPHLTFKGLRTAGGLDSRVNRDARSFADAFCTMHWMEKVWKGWRERKEGEDYTTHRARHSIAVEKRGQSINHSPEQHS